MITSLEQAAEALLCSGLLDDESLADSCHALERSGVRPTAAGLLSQLQAEGKLTPFQAEEVEHGRAGQLSLGNYRILSRIGEGGMGTVFKALHRRMERIVAVKVIRKEVATPDFIARFRREIQLSARLNHPNIVIAYDADQCAMGEFLVMEYVEGTDLGEALRRTGPLDLADAVSAIRQAASALDYAHQRAIIHRDIKPSNLLRDIGGRVKVVDLGLARVSTTADSTSLGLTRYGAVAGTVDYMSPEQADDPQSVDERSDIYSLGCTLFSLLTGGPVFSNSSLIARLMAHRNEPPPSLTMVRDDVPPALDAIFQRMLAKSPDARYASMADLLVALDTASRPPAAEHATVVLSRTPSAPATPNISGAPSGPLSPQSAWAPSRATVLIVEESRLQAGLIRKFLAELGVSETHVCSTGAEALERLSQISPHVVLSSQRLADMSGTELAARIRDSLRCLELAIVLMSSDESQPTRLGNAQRMARVQFLKKPFDSQGLRAAIERAVSDRGHERESLAGLGDLRVLIVDDSGVARRHEIATLRELGFSRFTETVDGVDAVEQLRNSQFDLVVTDYHMPRMDGRELISHIRQQDAHREVPIIMVTTEFDPRKLAPVYQLGVSAICNKSFERDLVRNIVIQLFA